MAFDASESLGLVDKGLWDAAGLGFRLSSGPDRSRVPSAAFRSSGSGLLRL